MATAQLDPIAEDEANWPTDMPQIVSWRGRAKARHTAALNKASSAMDAGRDRDSICALRINVVSAYNEVEVRHDWLMKKRPAPIEGEIDNESKWLTEITTNHRSILMAIDKHLGPAPTPSLSSSHRSRSSNRSSTSSTRARLQESERLEREAALKLQQISEEAERRLEEDEYMDQQKLDQRKRERQIEADRKKRSAEAELEIQKLNASILRRQVEETEDTTPLPDVNQLNNLTNHPQYETPSGYGETGRIQPIAHHTNQSAVHDGQLSLNEPTATLTANQPPSGPRVPGVFSQFFSRALGALTPRRTNPPTFPTWNRIPSLFQRPTGPQSTPLAQQPIPLAQQPIPLAHQPIPLAQQPTPLAQQPIPLAQQPPPPMIPPVAKLRTNPPVAPLVPPANPQRHVRFPPLNPLGFPAHNTGGQPVGSGGQPNTTNFGNPPQNPIPGVGAPNQLNPFVPVFLPSGPAPTSPVVGQTDAYTPDSWIFELDNPMIAQQPVLRPHIRPPRMELQKFDGDPRQWPMFIQSFKIQVHDTVDCDAVRLAHLRGCLSPEIQSHIGEALVNPGLYQFALTELQRKFGNPQIVSQACTNSLLELQPFKDDDSKSLRHFASTLHSVVATLNHSGYGLELYSNTTLFQLVSKLPPILRSRWGEVSWSLQPQVPNLLHFDWWLDNVSMANYTVQTITPNQQNPTRSGRAPSHAADSRGRTRSSSPSVYHSSSAAGCSNCDGNHHLSLCYKFKAMSVEKRSELVKAKRLCFRCLAGTHIGSDCPHSEICNNNGCKGLHHPLLHGAPRIYPIKQAGHSTRQNVDFKLPPSFKSPPPSRSTTPTVEETPNFAGCTEIVHRGTLLPIVPVEIRSNGIGIKTYALLDNGSEITMVTGRIAELTRLRGPKETTKIRTVNGHAQPQKTMRVAFKLAATRGDVSFDIEDAIVISSLVLSKKAVNLKKLVKDWPHLATVPIEESSLQEVGILVGLDNPALHEIADKRVDPLNIRAPRAILTHFGWCIIGPVTSYKETTESNFDSFHLSVDDGQSTDERLDSLVKQFLLSDMFGVKPDAKPPIGREESRALEILSSTIRHIGDRYEVGLLWKNDEPRLPNNRKVALRRLVSLERRFAADAALAEIYRKSIDEYIHLKHARKLTPEEASMEYLGRTWYIPHHPVFNPNKPGVVFDGSLKFMGHSLNTELMKGPDFLPNLPGVLMRLRQELIAVLADIEKMFHQVRVRKEDGSAFRFLWRTPGSSEPPETYQMDVQIFGAISSPSICSYALRQAALDSGTHAAQVLKEVTDHFYVDNWLVSYPSEAEAISAANIMYDSMLKGGFKLTQWASSSSSVRSVLPDRAKLDSPVNLDLDAASVERTLGLRWDYRKDVFILKVTVPEFDGKTKRAILRTVSSIFDPLGFLAAVTFTAKCLLQDIWRTEVGWDDEIEAQLLERWRNWLDTLASLESLTIPRRYFLSQEDHVNTQLHIFADASELGFGAVAYLRREYSNHVDVSFVMAKSRVAALKFATIHRKELCAAVMAVRLCTLVTKELRIPLESTTYWSDSSTVLSWINSTSFRFHTYVGNRLGEILDSSQPEQWRYVRTAANPADDVSRGLDAAKLTLDHRWFTGPQYLRSPPVAWPATPPIPPPDPNDPEVRSSNWVGFVQRQTDSLDLLISKSSRWYRLVRTVAYVLRWALNIRTGRGSRSGGELTAAEITAARIFLIRRTQQDSYAEEIADLRSEGQVSKGSHLIQLTPFLDQNGVLCVGGRLDNAPLPFNARHPIILPAKSHLTDILIWRAHQDCAHSSNERTLHELRRQYWVPKGLITIRRVVKACVLCKRFNPKPLQPKMASLPFFRLQPGLPAFARTGVDYFGPIEVSIFRRKVKRWGCLFTCLSSRAVCLVMAYSLNTDSFISCLNRFESRFGTPLSYHSDNGTNFVGAKNEFEDCFKRMDQAKISNHLSRREVQWHFNPPAAPHFGGAWERLVRSAKRALLIVTSGHSMTDEVLVTSLAYAENMLNNRPLGVVSSDPRSPEPLTPNHLLLTRANPNLPPDVFHRTEISSKKKWRSTEALMDQFWERWQAEWIPSLLLRQKWTENQRNLRVGDIVMLIAPASPRGTWPIGRVFKVNPSADGVVRSVWIWTQGTELYRPVVDLCLLEAEDDEEADNPADVAPIQDVIGPAMLRISAPHKFLSYPFPRSTSL